MISFKIELLAFYLPTRAFKNNQLLAAFKGKDIGEYLSFLGIRR